MSSRCFSLPFRFPLCPILSFPPLFYSCLFRFESLLFASVLFHFVTFRFHFKSQLCYSLSILLVSSPFLLASACFHSTPLRLNSRLFPFLLIPTPFSTFQIDSTPYPFLSILLFSSSNPFLSCHVVAVPAQFTLFASLPFRILSAPLPSTPFPLDYLPVLSTLFLLIAVENLVVESSPRCIAPASEPT